MFLLLFFSLDYNHYSMNGVEEKNGMLESVQFFKTKKKKNLLQKATYKTRVLNTLRYTHTNAVADTDPDPFDVYRIQNRKTSLCGSTRTRFGRASIRCERQMCIEFSVLALCTFLFILLCVLLMVNRMKRFFYIRREKCISAQSNGIRAFIVFSSSRFVAAAAVFVVVAVLFHWSSFRIGNTID